MFAGLKGHKPVEIVTDQLISKGVTVVGAFGVDSHAYSEAIKIIESGRFPVGRLHTHTFGLERAGEAITTLEHSSAEDMAMHVTLSPLA